MPRESEASSAGGRLAEGQPDEAAILAAIIVAKFVDSLPLYWQKKMFTSKCFMWACRGGDPEKAVVLFRYSPTRSVEVAHEILAD